MRGLTASDVLEVHERGRSLSQGARAVLLLAAAGAMSDPDDLIDLTVGRRNALLLRVRRATFGSGIEGLAVCPACGEKLEIEIDVEGLEASVGDQAAGWQAMVADGWDISYRPPTVADLAMIEAQPDAKQARRALIARCVRVQRDGKERNVARLPAGLVRGVGEAIAAADPNALIDLVARCPSCDDESVVTLDIAAYLWGEVEARVPLLLLEVHELATAYGWSEERILAMSPWRRHAYRSIARP